MIIHLYIMLIKSGIHEIVDEILLKYFIKI